MEYQKKFKILVFAPRKFAHIIMSFPFFNELQKVPNIGEINVIVHPKYRDLFSFLGKDIRVFDFDENIHSGPMNVHKFCYNLNDVFNIDHYFSLANGFSSAFMGFCFQAKYRYGQKENVQDLFFTHKWEKPESEHEANTFLSLLKLMTQRDYEEQKVLGPEVVPYYEDWLDKRYIVVHLDRKELENSRGLEIWRDFLNYFEGQRFIFLGDEEDRLLIDQFISGLSAKNEYLNLANKTQYRELASIVSYAQGLIGINSGPAHLASFLGVKVALWDSTNSLRERPEYTRAGYFPLNLDTNMNESVDEVYRVFDLK